MIFLNGNLRFITDHSVYSISVLDDFGTFVGRLRVNLGLIENSVGQNPTVDDNVPAKI